MLPIVAILAGGCSLLGGGSYISDPSCPQDAYGWAGGLARWVDLGPGDGTFDVEPPEVEIARVRGSYDLETGDFSYTVTYADGYYLERAEVEGYGTVYTNGDVDLLYTRELTDVLGDVYAREVREERVGCKTTATMTDWLESVDEAVAADRDWELTAVFESDDQVSSQLTWSDATSTYTWEGAAHADFSVDYSSTYEELSTSFTAEGRVESDATDSSSWTQLNGDGTSYVGTTDVAFDGSRHQEYDYYDADDTLLLTCTVDYAYDGSGEGACTYTEAAGGGDCTFEITAEGDCTYVCVQDGQTYEGTC